MAHTERDAQLAFVAKRQHGTFSFAQAISIGFPSSTIGHRLRTGAWERRLPGVFALGGSPRTRAQDLWVAVLATGPGAVVSHESAALLHGAEQLPLSPLTLTRRHGSHHRLRGLFVHQINDLLPSHHQVIKGLPVSTAARCVVELGATQSLEVVGRVADDLVRSKRTTFGTIAGVLAQVARPGKPGVEKVARMLDERGDGYVPPASELERALFVALELGGLPRPVRQLPLPGRGTVNGIADGGYLDARIVLEADGRRWHGRLAAARQDRERDARVVRAGWVPLRFVYEQIVREPEELSATVDETRRVRLAQLRGAA